MNTGHHGLPLGVYPEWRWIGWTAGGFRPRTTNGATPAVAESSTNDIMDAGCDFSDSTKQAVQMRAPLPPTYAGEPMQFWYNWGAPSGTPAGVTWGASARIYSRRGEAIDQALGVEQITQDILLATGSYQWTPKPSPFVFPAGALGPGPKLLIVQISRVVADGNDAFASPARLGEVLCCIQAGPGR